MILCNQNIDNLLITGEEVRPFVLVIALEQVLKIMNTTFRNSNNAETKGPLMDVTKLKEFCM